MISWEKNAEFRRGRFPLPEGEGMISWEKMLNSAEDGSLSRLRERARVRDKAHCPPSG